MVRRAERPLRAANRFLAAADRRPDADDLQPLRIGQRRQDGGEAFCHHALARPGRAGETYDMLHPHGLEKVSNIKGFNLM